LEEAPRVPFFHPGGDKNRLTLVVQGPRVAVLINGEPLPLINDPTLKEGQVSLGVENHIEGTTLQVRFNRLKIWDISDLSPGNTPSASEGAALDVALLWSYAARTSIWHLDSWGDGLASGNLDGDRVPDVVLGTSGGDVIAVNGANGEELWSLPITARGDAAVHADLVDLDGEGRPEVVATGAGDEASQGRAVIRALSGAGEETWDFRADYEEVLDLAYGDLDGDGDIDVVASVGTYPWEGGGVILLDGLTGAQLWSTPLGGGQSQGLDVGDVDGDGDLEVAVENYDNQVILLDGASGQVLWSRPKDYHGRDVVIADVDADGVDEIVSAVANVIAFDASGEQRWAADQGGDLLSIGDLDGDDQPEVIVSATFGGELHVLRGRDGGLLWSRPRGGAHAVGDVDGDGVDDVVAATVNFYGIEPPYFVDAVDGANKLLWRYPLVTIYNEIGFGLTLANLDDDPALEVLVANGTQLLALDTGSGS
jgi:outer membrane protein assembly factor BamB